MQAFRLAKLLGVWNVDALLAEMPSSLYNDWMDFLDLEPDGFAIQDYHFSNLACVIANTSGNVKKPYKLSDFSVSPKQEQTPEQQLAIIDGL